MTEQEVIWKAWNHDGRPMSEETRKLFIIALGREP